jgi:hypothetical protein
MSDKYYLWLQELQLRDQTYLQLAVIVGSLFLGWLLIGVLIHDKYKDISYTGYSVMMAVLYMVTLIVTVFNG